MKTRFPLMAAGATILTIALPAGSASSADVLVPSMPWLHEGLALTYTWHAAKAAGNGSDYQEDPNGGWIDRRTGQRLSRLQQHGTLVRSSGRFDDVLSKQQWTLRLQGRE